jgi:hypothetical protein
LPGAWASRSLTRSAQPCTPNSSASAISPSAPSV